MATGTRLRHPRASRVERVIVAMSGGVDSSVAAALLLRRGYDVVGTTLRLHACLEAARTWSCCGPDGVVEARRAAGHLGIPHYVLDCRRPFEDLVLRPSWNEYSRGRTPNPCVACNERIKFRALGDLARGLGARWIATGHYARIRRPAAGGDVVLYRARHLAKDQSYFLFPIGPELLSMTLFPTGDLSKDEVRATAREVGLPNAERRESQDACLGRDGQGFAESLRSRFGGSSRPGPIVDPRGREVGRHGGIHLYTIGQRRGLRVALGRRLWVRSIHPEQGTVTVTANEDDLLCRELIVHDVRWTAPDQDRPSCTCTVQIRYRQTATEARVEPRAGGTAKVVFANPQRAVTPGQAAVFYDGDRVIGGGWIDGVH